MKGLTTEAVSLSLGGRCVLREVSAHFAPGCVTALLGPNGAGKSTLLACLAGLRQPDRGRVLIDGTARSSLSRQDAARRIGLLPQTADIHWDIDVATLVALGRYPHRGRWADREDDQAAIAKAMAITDITALATRAVSALSGGERARVLLARVLAGTPEWLLADEPLANLDPAHQHDALDCLRAAARDGAGVIVVLHDLSHALRIADHVLLLSGGRTVAQGSAQSVLTAERIGETFCVVAELGTTNSGERFMVSTGRVRQ